MALPSFPVVISAEHSGSFVVFRPKTFVFESRKRVVHQVGQIWLYRALVKAFERSLRDLAIEKGFSACSLEDKRKS